MIEAMEESGTEVYHLSDEERLLVDEGLDQAKRGQFVSDEDMEKFWNRHGGHHDTRCPLLSEHRSIWGDWLAIGVGVLIGLTPWFAGLPENPALVLNSALVGVVVWGCP